MTGNFIDTPTSLLSVIDLCDYLRSSFESVTGGTIC
jgi:hypothetical protein